MIWPIFRNVVSNVRPTSRRFSYPLHPFSHVPHSCVQARFYVGQGELPPPELPPPKKTSALPPNILVTAVTHQHTGAKRSVIWPSKYAKIRFQPWLRPGPHCGSSRHFLSPPVGWRGHMTPQTTLHSAPSAPRFSRLRRSPIGPSV